MWVDEKGLLKLFSWLRIDYDIYVFERVGVDDIEVDSMEFYVYVICWLFSWRWGISSCSVFLIFCKIFFIWLWMLLGWFVCELCGLSVLFKYFVGLVLCCYCCFCGFVFVLILFLWKVFLLVRMNMLIIVLMLMVCVWLWWFWLLYFMCFLFWCWVDMLGLIFFLWFWVFWFYWLLWRD